LVGRRLWLVAVMALGVACATPMVSTLAEPPTPVQLAELWVDPEPDRDLFWGVGGKRLAPDPDAVYTVTEIKREGFSRGYTVVDPGGREWSAKFPPEAQTEVVASRLLWGLGYHQPPIYYLESWRAHKAHSHNPQQPARFREADPDLHGLDAEDTWSYYRNPFVGTPQLSGLLVLHVMLGNSDLKDDNNRIYELEEPLESASRWYVARDLGQSFGRTGWRAPRNDLPVFEKTPFILSVAEGLVTFDYRGRHRSLFSNITPADVRWISERLDALTDRQWSDAFRAGGYDEPTAERFIRRMKQKVQEGLALQP
jgi:hypothetical protein